MKCKSCGKELVDHLGHEGICYLLQKAVFLLREMSAAGIVEFDEWVDWDGRCVEFLKELERRL